MAGASAAGFVAGNHLNKDEPRLLRLRIYPGGACHANRRRIKIVGRAQLIEVAEDPILTARLQVSGYRARVEPAVVIAVEAHDWNSPQHITPRYTEPEMAARTSALQEELTRLRALLEIS